MVRKGKKTEKEPKNNNKRSFDALFHDEMAKGIAERVILLKKLECRLLAIRRQLQLDIPNISHLHYCSHKKARTILTFGRIST